MIGPGMGPGMGPPPPGLRPPHGMRHGKNFRHHHPPPGERKKELKELKWADFKFLVPYLKRHWKSILGAILVLVTISVLSILPPLILKNVIDIYVPAKDVQQVLRNGLFLIIIYIVLYFTSYLQNRVMVITGQKVVREIREAVFAKYLTYPIAYYEENKRGTLLSIVTGDVNVLSDSITMGIINLFSSLFSLILVISIMISLDAVLGILITCIYPIIFLSVRRYRSKMHDNFFEIREKMAEMNANIEENISGIRVAQSLAVEKRNVKGFNQISQETYDLRMKSTNLFASMDAVMAINMYVTMAILLGIGGYRYIEGAITIGVLIAFVQYSNQFMSPIQEMSHLTNMFIEAGAALLHIRKSMENIEEIPEPEHPVDLPAQVEGTIDLKNVKFSYTQVPLFEDLTFSINAKEKIGIVGETGAGKSTFINLITRLYDVQGGEIAIDGIDIRTMRKADLNALVAIVSQNVFLFSDTIYQNILFGRPNASEAEVHEAAALARAALFVEKLPEKYNTKLGEQGSGLSGGQRQLIAYARMILARPKIAILDEATSNIDSYTENLIQKNMEDIFTNTTVIIIAHRFATLQKVDRIVVLKNGKIQAIGTHPELLENNAYYQELCEKQYSKL